MRRLLNCHGHILEEQPAQWSGFAVDDNGIEITFPAAADGWVLDTIIWKLSDPLLANELSQLGIIETQGYFLLGSHTRYDRPADLYRHLIHGFVYEDRYAWPHKRRICSENDAHALHLVFCGLQRATGKRIYRLLQDQLLLSVLSRQSEDGGFRHGEWSDGMESHFRLHCSAMHLMMDALGDRGDTAVTEALRRAAQFIADKHDRTSVGVWFYHDELECSADGMARGPFRWWPGTALGKARQNMLVLNTHLGALIALDRYRRLSGDGRFTTLVDSGFEAAWAVLALRPMEWLYRILFSAIDLTLLPTAQAAALPAWKRMWKRIGWKVFVPWLPRIKTRYPRLTMPGGYVDRELSLQGWAHDYLAVNLMDLVRAADGNRRAIFGPFVEGIVAYCTRTRIAVRWLEQAPRAYAVGFLAEAMYLLCRQQSRAEFDAMLADSLVLCARHSLGLPPSLLGANGEAQEVRAGRLPQGAQPGIVVADLSRNDRVACLIVNTGTRSLELPEALAPLSEGWQVPSRELAPGGWIRVEQ
ncbi:hypothetical protein [Aromatoleum petrolei]|uniref:N-acyl-D-glucosamine 2-epimerase n=1 Tax=Aromatoleum petrolei TaxID=76116 RepID=A0ABX1MHV5_9RHOO|nr:hypothetical protein [Aromatoleum petrolei]NMF87363.1 hypothetical protein [Aromatoleum petrolei]QTQ35730.1 Uncharacterized protein ToN1_15730 [Aromatoleum petrolei]